MIENRRRIVMNWLPSFAAVLLNQRKRRQFVLKQKNKKINNNKEEALFSSLKQFDESLCY